VIGSGSFSNLAIKKSDKEAHDLGVSLNFVRAMFYGTLTYLYSIDQIVKLITKKDMEDMDLVTSVVIRMSFWQMVFADPNIPSYAVVSSAVDITKIYNPKASGLVNALLRKIGSADKDLLDIRRKIMAPPYTLKEFNLYQISFGILDNLMSKPNLVIREPLAVRLQYTVNLKHPALGRKLN
jgi:transcription termination factor NusB